MELAASDLEFLREHHSAGMITIAEDGTPKVARVGVTLIDGKLWSSGTAGRVRTERLRRDPRCTLYVHDPKFSWLALETEVTILDGPDAPQLNLRLFRAMQERPSGPLSWFGKELDEDDFLAVMVDDRRLVFEFEPHRVYGIR